MGRLRFEVPKHRRVSVVLPHGGGIGNTYMICTKLDPATLTWGADISSPVDWTYPDVFG